MIGVQGVALLSAGYSYSAEALALFSNMTTQPTVTRKQQIDSFIKALKSAGVWTKLDVLHVFAAADSQAARLNWVSGSFTSTAVNSPTFTADRGYTGDGATSYLDSGFTPSTATSPKFTQNSAHMGVWIRGDVSNSAQIDCGTLGNARICGRSGTVTIVRGNSVGSNLTLPVSTSVGHTCWSRDNSASFETYKNGAALASSILASSAVSALPFYSLAVSTAGPTANSFSTRPLAIEHWGGALTATEALAFYNAVSNYVTAVGA